MVNIYSSITIITDKEGQIIDCNFLARNELNIDNYIGKNIFDISNSLLDTMTLFKSEGKSYDIYIYRRDGYINEFLEYVLDNSYDEIFITNGSGIVLYCNNAFEEHYSIKRQDILGKDANMVQEEGYADKVLVHEAIKNKKTITFIQNTKNNKTILNTIKPILNEKGEVIYVIENCRDISKQTQLEKAIRDKERQIEKYEEKIKYFSTLNKKSFLTFNSQSMQTIGKTLEKLSSKDVNILLLGQSGTGKTFMANYIHEISSRKNGPFVTIDCTTIPNNLMESELFGYVKGSFTGALKDKSGLVKEADGGTLFLDEIGELPLSLQGKLLRLIQEKTFTPIGQNRPEKVDIRIITATNRDLLKLIEEGKFREDLYYRIALGVVEIPPLKDRKEDIEELLNYFIEFFNKKYNSNILLAQRCKDVLLNYSWPGNIRELEHTLEFLIINSSDDNKFIDIDLLPSKMLNSNPKGYNLNNISFDDRISFEEEKIVRESYSKYKNSYKVANDLKISQSKAFRLIKKYHLNE